MNAHPASVTQSAPLGSPKAGGGRLELLGLRRSFGSYNALAGIDLSVEKGEFIALLGPSGCGKSTALNCIAGLLPLTGGEIRLDGRRIDELQPEERGFGMVFQSYALFPHMTIRKNVGFGLAMQGVPRAEAEERVERALDLVRLREQGDKLPGQLSGGQQQRVAIARAIVIRPPLVLMDEPLSNLDAKLRLEMRAEIRAIHDAIGSTTIYVTHDQDEALSLADRIVVMSQGVIRQVGRPEDLYERPNHLDVADFMGFRTKIEGRVVESGGGRTLIEADGGRFWLERAGEAGPGAPITLSIRPEDLVAARDGEGLKASVRSSEYRGRAYFGVASLAGGAPVYFRSDAPVSSGETIVLNPDPQRTLIFSGAAR
ncbi:ABC transporter ATP-binding protein [Aurantimonas sp. Leaf443]|uniref:ABC transporter ATP-binding protein n=1 Tax=Aurantimonas sp. Leaf443 TaxID=1736378 RepID=UPI0006FC0F97|nr:ABC transporter ATP-binding protein [Aurantimonas sp. Leaf443]KQT84199.1 spermidine/putrescine ABC transporter ATP-binding protein [Aurantimonas sp. Leaf443]